MLGRVGRSVGWLVGRLTVACRCSSPLAGCCLLLAGNSGFSFSVRSLCVLRPQSSRCGNDDSVAFANDYDFDYDSGYGSGSGDILFFRLEYPGDSVGMRNTSYFCVGLNI